jgi:signal transduction histidine kinase
LKFTERGGRIDLRVRRLQDGRLEISVSDTGSGLAEDEVERVMEPFVRGSQARHQSSEGLGLGLALSRSLAELHGGSLHLTSRLGEGTVAHLYVPQDRVRS